MTLKKSIHELANAVVTFVKKDFHLLSYIYVLLFTLVCIFINYNYGFYNAVMRPTYYNGQSIWAFFVFYSFFYFAAAIPVFLLRKEYAMLKKPAFYFKSLFFILLYSVAVGYYSYRNWDFTGLLPVDKNYLIRLISRLKSCFFIMLPLILLKITLDKKTEGLYGLSKNSKNLKAYFTVFLFMLPFLIAVSFTPDFLKAYPQFKVWYYEGAFGLPTWLSASLFEICYALDFVNTELFFRGALVIGMTAIIGPRAVLPMVAFYAAIHFGKPVGETLSSIFGGYLLGALAYETKHIWGGVIAHIGIALTMEIMGFLHYYVLGTN